MGEPAVSILAGENIDDEAAGHILLFAISRLACLRMFGLLPSVQGSWYLAADLRQLGRALVAVEGESELADVLLAPPCLAIPLRMVRLLDIQRLLSFSCKSPLTVISHCLV